MGDSPAENLVERGRWAASLDLARRLRGAGVAEVCVVTPDPARCPGGGEHIEFIRSEAGTDFHFGRTLARVSSELGLDGFLYFGSGSGGLMPEGDLARMVSFASGDAPRALFNNFYSCDFCAVACAGQALAADLPSIDNPLGFALSDAGVPCLALPRSASTQFDIDTPTDLLVAAESALELGELRAFCLGLESDHPSLGRALAVLTERSATTMLVGRLSPATWSHFEGEVASRTSALVEGRGMRAGSSQHLLWVRQVLAEDGPTVFFERLARACDAAWIDTRPLLGTEAATAPASDRFASDLYRIEEIRDPAWRAFTAAALRSPIPVVLGGHSLVGGDLYLAAQACWKGRNLARRLHPETFA